jgi:hypothetical protein
MNTDRTTLDHVTDMASRTQQFGHMAHCHLSGLPVPAATSAALAADYAEHASEFGLDADAWRLGYALMICATMQSVNQYAQWHELPRGWVADLVEGLVPEWAAAMG